MMTLIITDTKLKLANLASDLANLKKETQEKSKTLLEAVTLDFFKNYPEVLVICWTQYTPYFNDGDTCEFGVYDKHPVSASEEYSDLESLKEAVYELEALPFPYRKPNDYTYANRSKYTEYEDEIVAYEKAMSTPRGEEVKKATEDMLAILAEISDETYQDMFGEGMVILSKDGFLVEEYEHE